MAVRWLATLCLALTSAACGSDATQDAGAIGDAVSDAATNGDTVDAAADVMRGPAVLPIDGDANGLWWEASNATLYIADDNGNRVMTWRDDVGFAVLGELPAAAGSGPGLGQLVRASNGDVYVTRFGFGTQGDVAVLHADGTGAVVMGLDAARRRIGLALAADGTLIDGHFTGDSTTRVGGIARLTVRGTSGTEVEVATGLNKPVGILVIGSQVYLSDQSRNQVLVADLATPMNYRVFSVLTGADLLCAGPSGSLFAGSSTGTVYRIGRDGTASAFDTGYQSTRGVAYDAVHRRLFAAEHATTVGVMGSLHIVPVD